MLNRGRYSSQNIQSSHLKTFLLENAIQNHNQHAYKLVRDTLMARLTAAQADPARHKQIARLLLQFAEETYKNRRKEKQVFMVCVRNKRTALGYQQGALPSELVDSAQFHERKPISIIFLIYRFSQG